MTVAPPRFGRWEIVRILGTGGTALVHLACDAAGRQVALKQPRPDVPLDPWRVERFRREAMALRSLEHPGIIRLVDAGETGGRPWLAYELVANARTLWEAFRTASRRDRVRLVLEVASALGVAHAAGIVHRDVKPENILVDAAGRARVADFGLCAIAGLDPLTASGIVLGTPTFSAPELSLDGSRATSPACDVWSLGVLLFLALTGQHPFAGLSFYELVVRASDGAPSPRALAPGLSDELEALCRRALSVDPAARPRDAAAFARELAPCLALGATSLGASAELAPTGSSAGDAPALAKAVTGSRGLPAIEGLTIVSPLGAGAMGAVFRAVDSLGREVAVKLLAREALGSPVRRARFQREAEVIAKLRHPNIIGVHRAGEVDGRPYLVMDLVIGSPLEERLTAGPLPVGEALALARDLARALDHVHERGILHRDVKPANIIVDAHGVPHLLDFGIAKVLDDEERLTLSRQILGTASYMAPEQLSGAAVDGRTDVYGLGATLYAAITGSPPHADAATLEALMVRRVDTEPAAPSALRPEAGAAIDAVVLKSLAIDPAHRYESAAAFADDLERVLAGEAPAARAPRRRRRSHGLVVAAFAIVAGAVIHARRTPSAGALLEPAVARRAVDRLLRSTAPLDGAGEAAELVGDLPPDSPAALREETEALAGLIALVRSDVPAARVRLTRAEPCATPAARGLRGAIAVVASEADAEGARADLTAALQGGVRPDELRRLRLRLFARAGVRSEAAAHEVVDDFSRLDPLQMGREEREARAEALIVLGRLPDAEAAVRVLAPHRRDLEWRVALLGALKELAAGRASAAATRVQAGGPSDVPEVALLVTRATQHALIGLTAIEAGRPTTANEEKEVAASLSILGVLRPGVPFDRELDRRLLNVLQNYARETPGAVLHVLGEVAPPSPDLLWAIAIQTDGMAPRLRAHYRPTYERALALDAPRDRRPKLATLLARALLESEPAAVIALAARELPACSPGLETAELLEARAHARRAIGDNAGALADYDAARAACPDLLRLVGGRAMALRGLGREDEALEQAISLARDPPPGARSEVATILWDLGRPRGRIADVRRAIDAILSVDKDKPAWWIRSALLHVEAGEIAAARRALDHLDRKMRSAFALDSFDGSAESVAHLRSVVTTLDSARGSDGTD